jgi:hypothetical protein
MGFNQINTICRILQVGISGRNDGGKGDSRPGKPKRTKCCGNSVLNRCMSKSQPHYVGSASRSPLAKESELLSILDEPGIKPVIRLRVPAVAALEQDLGSMIVAQLELRQAHALAKRQQHPPLDRSGLPANPPAAAVAPRLGLLGRPQRALVAGLSSRRASHRAAIGSPRELIDLPGGISNRSLEFVPSMPLDVLEIGPLRMINGKVYPAPTILE